MERSLARQTGPGEFTSPGPVVPVRCVDPAGVPKCAVPHGLVPPRDWRGYEPLAREPIVASRWQPATCSRLACRRSRPPAPRSGDSLLIPLRAVRPCRTLPEVRPVTRCSGVHLEYTLTASILLVLSLSTSTIDLVGSLFLAPLLSTLSHTSIYQFSIISKLSTVIDLVLPELSFYARGPPSRTHSSIHLNQFSPAGCEHSPPEPPDIFSAKGDGGVCSRRGKGLDGEIWRCVTGGSYGWSAGRLRVSYVWSAS